MTRKTLARIVCRIRGHAFSPPILRPLWIGAGIVIPQVHLDVLCRRCGKERAEWRPLPRLPAPAAPMLVIDWLAANGVDRPQ